MSPRTSSTSEETPRSHVICTLLDALTCPGDYELVERGGELFLIPLPPVSYARAA
jgi:hypothetical protein